METIQVVLDLKLLKATDRVAHRKKVNRSALIRDALRDHLKRLEIQSLEERDRRAYEARPNHDTEWARWEAEAVWPDE
jgi:metal-responsive CopG/Arc/MetJ family transcriptional regulator